MKVDINFVLVFKYLKYEGGIVYIGIWMCMIVYFDIIEMWRLF